MRVFLRFLVIAIAVWTFGASAATHFVDLNSTNPVSPYTDWLTAATNIQDAMDSAVLGDTVLVTNGVYQYGGDFYNGSNRVDVASGLTLQSVNGPAVTVIQGYQVPGTTNGPTAVRCVYLHAFGQLIGFTLTGGATANSGGGLTTETQCVVSNCVISGNASQGYGGGASLGIGTAFLNCIVRGNVAFSGAEGGGVFSIGSGVSRAAMVNCVISNNIAASGGGVANCQAFNCLLIGNGSSNSVSGTSGGAAYFSTLNNCTVVGNFSRGLGACDGGVLNNSIIYYNFNNGYADCYQCQLTNCCTTIGLGTSSLTNNCFSNSPGFLNPSAGDYHLNPVSRCIDAGNAAQSTNTIDLDGNPRLVGASVDLGAYEHQSPYYGPAHYVSLLSTNPVPPFTTWTTAATNLQDGIDVAQAGEWVIADDGIYTNRGRVMFGAESNRIVLTNGATLASAGGAQGAIISGGTQTRCAYIGSNSVLSGFTLTGGRGRNSGDVTNEQSGAGAWCQTGGTISNCVILGNANTTGPLGGGVFRGSVYNSTIFSNSAPLGAGAALGAYFNCLFASNGMASISGGQGAGIFRGTASNCTFIANSPFSGYLGGGAYGSTLRHCTLLSNYSTLGGGGAQLSSLYDCTLIGNRSTYGGGGTLDSTNFNCVFLNNFATYGGAVNSGSSFSCVFSNNIAQTNGGGSYIGALTNCIFIGNQATNAAGEGGGAWGGGHFNSLFISNSAPYGGGIYGNSVFGNALVYNCTIIGNAAVKHGSGTYGGFIVNSIVYDNTSPADSNYYLGTLSYCCTTPLSTNTPNCFTNEPLFVDLAGKNFHLQSNSPCINSGNNLGVNAYQIAYDFELNSRIIGTAVDVGAYEFPNPASVLPYSWLWQYGLATDGSADSADTDGDGMSNYAEWRAQTSPTDASSFLAVQPPVVTQTNVTITWPSASGISYYVQATPDLQAQPFQSIVSNIVGNLGTTSYTDTNAVQGASLFYRVGVQ